MTALIFTEKDGLYESQIQVEGDIALEVQLQKNVKTRLQLYQSVSGDVWEEFLDIPKYESFARPILGLVAGMYIKVVVDTQPLGGAYV